MAKTPASEILSTLKTYFNQLSEGERTPAEVATAFNGWAKESAESIKAKIAEEVEATVSKMGFIKREEYDLLLERVSQLEKSSTVERPAGTSPKKSSRKNSESLEKKATAKKATAKKSTAKRETVKKVSR